MEHIPEQNRPGIAALKLPANIARLVAQADNLMITPDGAVEKGQLQTQEHRHVTVFELPRTDKKLAMVHEVMKELKALFGWNEEIKWLTKDLVLECSALSLPPGTTCVIIPQPYPQESQVIFHREKQVLGMPDWKSSIAYMLEPGISIRVKGTARFYAITFPAPPAELGGPKEWAM
ncbi:hypothetical protein CCUS01_06560 [Colletotrichum cuscutae]|uniref:Uncharacterized protein n=1 Tax=Colletotrichum cuscutae TaxID=1209917 RepID=A0AAI9V3Y7_9PEZI|nr:hypothetical protein CCUS01_06560 [Colletotrichum cuscutae]